MSLCLTLPFPCPLLGVNGNNLLDSESESVSHSVLSDLCDPCGLKPASLLCPWNSPGSYTGVGCHSLLQGIFLTQGLNLGPLHCRQILYHLSHQEHPNSKVKVAQWCPTLCDQWTIQSMEFSRPEYWSG